MRLLSLPTMKRRVIGIVFASGTLVLGLGTGAAFAYFADGGSGSGVGSVGSAQAVTVVTASGTPSSVLAPGSSADLTLTLNNPNSYVVTITGVSQNGTVVAVNASGTCSTTGVSVPTVTGLSIAVAAGDGVVVHIPLGAAMSSGSDSGCQRASFQIPVNLTVQK